MFHLSFHPSVQEQIDTYIESWKLRFRTWDEDWRLWGKESEKKMEEISALMRANFDTKIQNLCETHGIKIYSLEWSPLRQAIIPSEGIFLFLTYEENIETMTRYITDIEILRK